MEGVIELAGFRKLEQFEIKFLEKVCENTAAVFKNLKTADETRRLLGDSQEHSEMMKSQEEEMRQNMEELSATQEEVLRKEKEFSGMLKAYREKFGELDEAIPSQQCLAHPGDGRVKGSVARLPYLVMTLGITRIRMTPGVPDPMLRYPGQLLKQSNLFYI